ncbi:MAG: class I SAM-dependent methyltransferase [Xanthomonadales bacterium]|nr:class I SAM-dependent methyltransferase [Xanthomonadales bacterium]
MSRHTINMSDELLAYLQQVSLRESSLLQRLREETAKLPNSNMQICPEQGQFMRLLIELTGARRAIEIGTFTGYSAISVAAALPSNGKLITCDVNAASTAIAQRYWEEAGLGERIELRLGPGTETLDQLIASNAEPFDFGFIDADKENYDTYYERLLRLIRPGGLIAIDNVLWDGAVIDPEKNDVDTNAIRQLNSKLSKDERVSLSMLPIGDGLTLARVR